MTPNPLNLEDNMQFHLPNINHFIQEIFMTKTIIFQIPAKTVSEANKGGEHWTKKSRRHKTQKTLVKVAFMENNFRFNLPVIITLTRISPRNLDEHDNLRVSLKYIADAVSENILCDFRPGRSDDSKEITWQYDQKKGMVKQYAVEIKIEEI